MRSAAERPPAVILEVGAYPPPYGGVFVHIQRLCREAMRAGLRVWVADPFSDDAPPEKRALWGTLIQPLTGPRWLKLVRLLRACRSSRVIHFHGSALENLWILGLLVPALGRPYVVSIHSGNLPDRWRRMNALKRAGVRRLLARAAALVCVSQELQRFVASIIALPPRVLTLPAFIPPDPPTSIHPAVQELRTRCEKIVLTCGFPLDNYGIAEFVDAMRSVARERSVASVIVLYPVTDPSSEDRFREETARVRRAVEEFAGSSASVLTLESIDPDVFSSVQAGCDVFVRNTLTDGDSVALRESGHLGCQIVASDAVERPSGSLLFRARDSRALTQAITVALDDPSLGRVASPADNARPILDLYRDLLGGSS